MKTTHKTWLCVMMGERSTTPEFDPDPAGLPPSGNPYIRLVRHLPVDESLPCSQLDAVSTVRWLTSPSPHDLVR
jgi:hypothetical protein